MEVAMSDAKMEAIGIHVVNVSMYFYFKVLVMEVETSVTAVEGLLRSWRRS